MKVFFRLRSQVLTEVYVKAHENQNALVEERQRGEALAKQRSVAEQKLEEAERGVNG